MPFELPAVISLVSHAVTLKPGNMVFTGTPGALKRLRHGDVPRWRRRFAAGKPRKGRRDLLRHRLDPAIDFDAMRSQRLVRVREAMARNDLDAILAFEYANTRYIAGLRPLWASNFLLRQAALITRGNEDVICLVHQDDTPHRRTTMYWLKPQHIREFPTAVVNEQAPPSALEPIRQGLEELGFS